MRYLARSATLWSAAELPATGVVFRGQIWMGAASVSGAVTPTGLPVPSDEEPLDPVGVVSETSPSTPLLLSSPEVAASSPSSEMVVSTVGINCTDAAAAARRRLLFSPLVGRRFFPRMTGVSPSVSGTGVAPPVAVDVPVTGAVSSGWAMVLTSVPMLVDAGSW